MDRPGPHRAAVARAARRGVHPFPGGARAAARGRQAGRHPHAVPALRRPASRRRSSTSSGPRSSLGGDEMMVEFRHRSWLEPDAKPTRRSASCARWARPTSWSMRPRTEARNLVPTVVATTSGHGLPAPARSQRRHLERRGRSAAERFDYLYSPEELAEWSAPLRELSSLSERTYVMFNNNGRSAGPAARRSRRRRRTREMLRDDPARRRRGGHGCTTISPSVSTPSTTPSVVRTRLMRAGRCSRTGPRPAPGRSRARAGSAFTMQATPSTAKPAPDDLVWPGRPVRERRHDPARGQADGEGGEPGPPPGQVGALVGEPRAPGRVAGLVEGAPAGRLLAALDLRHGR